MKASGDARSADRDWLSWLEGTQSFDHLSHSRAAGGLMHPSNFTEWFKCNFMAAG
jgi:hypothetical protein